MATNYMLNQSVWEEFNGEKADEAYGGPTLPLFKASYNDTCNPGAELDIQPGGYGYVLKVGNSGWNAKQDVYTTGIKQIGLYFKGSNYPGANGMWIASPSCTYKYTMLSAWTENHVTETNYFYYDSGFRPVVALKTNVLLTANDDGTYSIN